MSPPGTTSLRGTRVIAVNRNVNAVERVEYGVDGVSCRPSTLDFQWTTTVRSRRGLDWPPGNEGMTSTQVLEHLESLFGLWVPRESEERRLTAEALSTS